MNDVREAAARLEREIGTVFLGKPRVIRLALTAFFAQGHLLLEDVPGVGKTLLARAFARALNLGFARVQGTPDLLPGDVTGSSVYEGGAFRYIPGPIFTNVLLVDEINRATPRTQAALLEAMQERQVSADGETRSLPEPFIVLATENPVELEGTFALPEAELDRFLVRITLGYPSRESELKIAQRYRSSAEPLDSVPAVADAARIAQLRAVVRELTLGPEVLEYLVDLVRATRDHPELRLGASPRSTVALYRAAQAWAFLDGRRFALPEDVRAVAPSVLGHRLLVDIDRRLRGTSPDEIVAVLLRTVPVPLADAS